MIYHQVTAPHFCAAVGTNYTGVIWDTAPILNWAKGMSIDRFIAECQKRGWKYEKLSDPLDDW
jgi:hypothetical protein